MAETERGDQRPPRVFADEKTTLIEFLDYLRDSVAAKTAGVSDEQARKPMVPSGTSLLGLVKHLRGVELGWFAWSFAGEDGLSTAGGDLAPGDTVESVVAAYREAAAHCNQLIVSASLDQRAARSRREGEEPATLRWILVHIVEETARHAGHADILREQIDGSVGR
ncbi:MAG: DinB family protein [Chloroflexota bacterium]